MSASGETLQKRSKSTMNFLTSDEKQPKPPTFLRFHVERESVSSVDLHLRNVTLNLDDLEIDIDAEMLNGIHVSFVCYRYEGTFI